MATTKSLAPDAATIEKTAKSPVSASKSNGKQQFFSATIAAGQDALSEAQMKILEDRGIETEMAVRYGWRTVRRDSGEELLEIPYYKLGEEVNCKTRTLGGGKSEKRFYQRENAVKCLYNVDVIKEIGDKPLVVTEGELDAMIALQCGYSAVSVPDGAPKEAIGDKETRKYEYLRDIPKTLAKIILATDGDNPGVNLMHDLGLRLGRHRCMWIPYPRGCKDLNDIFLKYGPKGVKQTIDRAQFMKIDGLYRLSELPPRPVYPALDVGMDALNDHFRLRQGDLSVFSGIPSMGKTTIANQIAFNMAKTHGWNVCVASFEQHPQTEQKRALRTLYAGRPAHLLSEAELAEADKWIDRNFSFIVPNEDSDDWVDMPWLKDRMAAAVVRNGAKLIIIDPWNEMDHMFDGKEQTLTQYVGTAIKELKRFAQKYMVHVMIIAHPAKMQKKPDGAYPIPSAYDISDSAAWYNKPDQIVIVHRVDNERTLVRVSKSRYHQILGKPGDVEVHFNDYTYRYS